MKLFDWIGQLQDGMGQGVAPLWRGGMRPTRLIDSRQRILRDVSKVIIETWDPGPFQTNLCWLLADAQDRILFVVPTGAMESERLFAKIGKAPGFKRAAIRRALRSTRHARITIWERQNAAA